MDPLTAAYVRAVDADNSYETHAPPLPETPQYKDNDYVRAVDADNGYKTPPQPLPEAPQYNVNEYVRAVDADNSYENHPPPLPEAPQYNENEYPDDKTAANREPVLTGRERRSLFRKTRDRSSPDYSNDTYDPNVGPKSRTTHARRPSFGDMPPALPGSHRGSLSTRSIPGSQTKRSADQSESQYAHSDTGSPSESSDWTLGKDENGKRYRENTRTGEWYYV